jgi:hypothetical protein
VGLGQGVMGLDWRVGKLVEPTAETYEFAVAFESAHGGGRYAGCGEFRQTRHSAISENPDRALRLAFSWVDHGAVCYTICLHLYMDRELMYRDGQTDSSLMRGHTHSRRAQMLSMTQGVRTRITGKALTMYPEREAAGYHLNRPP